MNQDEPPKAPPGPVPPLIVQRQAGHVCMLPTKSKVAFIQPGAMPAAAAPKPKLEQSLEKKVADEVERRLRDRGDNFFVGFLLGELLSCWWNKHDQD